MEGFMSSIGDVRSNGCDGTLANEACYSRGVIHWFFNHAVKEDKYFFIDNIVKLVGSLGSYVEWAKDLPRLSKYISNEMVEIAEATGKASREWTNCSKAVLLLAPRSLKKLCTAEGMSGFLNEMTAAISVINKLCIKTFFSAYMAPTKFVEFTMNLQVQIANMKKDYAAVIKSFQEKKRQRENIIRSKHHAAGFIKAGTLAGISVACMAHHAAATAKFAERFFPILGKAFKKIAETPLAKKITALAHSKFVVASLVSGFVFATVYHRYTEGYLKAIRVPQSPFPGEGNNPGATAGALSDEEEGIEVGSWSAPHSGEGIEEE